MDIQSTDREASATIRGFVYQFDATIQAILNLKDDEELTIEGIEDIDVCGSTERLYIQCKYYAAERLTPSTLRNAILPMIVRFHKMEPNEREKCKYVLYGYYKDSTPSELTIDLDYLKKALITSKLDKDTKERPIINLQEEIGISDADLSLFIQKLTIHLCSEYSMHKNEVIDSLQLAYSESRTVANEFLYPSALSLISNIASDTSKSDRKICKEAFLQRIKPSQALYNSWALKEKGIRDFCKSIRTRYFSPTNSETIDRLFIIEIPNGSSDKELMQVLYNLRWKWSTYKSKRKPDCERYAPYVFFRNIAPERLVKLKSELQRNSVIFVDGFSFSGAEFCIDNLCTQPTNNYPVSLRFINSLDIFNQVIVKINKEKIFYHFFKSSPFDIEDMSPQINIPIQSIDMVLSII